MKSLNDDEKWMIVENLLNNLFQLEDTASELDEGELREQDGLLENIENHKELLDKIAPNWHEADSCREIEFNEVKVDAGE